MKTKLMSRRGLIAGLGAICALSLMSPLAFAAGKQDFTLHNETGKTIKEVYIAPHSDEEWGEDVMGDDVLENGEEVDIEFDPKEKADSWDMRVVFSDGKVTVWTKLMLTDITDVTLSYKDGKPWAKWKKVK